MIFILLREANFSSVLTGPIASHLNPIYTWALDSRPGRVARERGCHSAVNELILIHAFSYEPPPFLRLVCRSYPGARFLRVDFAAPSYEKRFDTGTGFGPTNCYSDADANTGAGCCPDAHTAA
jgi:hypothetical protein